MCRSIPRRATHGFSLIELLVSLVISMVATVAIFELLVVADRQTRSTSSGADAQMSGHLGSYMIDRELQQASYGLGRLPADFVNCEVKGFHAAANANFSFRLAPAGIAQGRAGQADRLTIIVGSSPLVPVRVGYAASTDTSKRLRSRAGYMPPTANLPGDLFLALSGGATPQCALLQVSSLGGDDYTVFHEAGVNAPFNPPGPLAVLAGEGITFNLGRAPRVQEWYVDPAARALRVRNLLDPAGTARSVADGVVDLQAEYGVEDPVTGVRWVATPASAAEWAKVTSIRFAVAVQMRQHEKEEVTQTPPVWTANGQALDAVTSLPDWKHYRYRVYETTASLRNVLWGR
jgi:type IV pilus assembly protein PilW